MKNLFTILIFSLFINHLNAQIDIIHPPNWWVGFENQTLQILVKGEKISQYNVSVDYYGVSLKQVHKADSENYLFVDLNISNLSEPGIFKLKFKSANRELEYNYKLDNKRNLNEQNNGFDSSDVIYLITPDRFANGNYSNDIIKGLKEDRINRDDNYARHGGDLQGISDNIDYLKDMGFTSLWLNPVLINDMKEGSYHGYATTDYYTVDPRLGTVEDYLNLSTIAEKNNIKLIKDIIVNHCGLYHWWMEDLPFDNWLNFQEIYLNSTDDTIEQNTVYSNHRRSTIQDIYAAKVDYRGMLDGWFVPTMPDLNQRNKFMAEYLIQNSIWWIETLNLSGIRQDTYPYAEKEFLSDWAGRIMNEYPKFNIVGEEWSYNPIRIAYWQNGIDNKDGYQSNLKSTMDFAMQKAIFEGIYEKENWDTGLIKVYESLANDFYYNDPNSLLVFNDNHDMSRIYTQMKEDVSKTKMAIGLMLMLPRIPQILYGTEILMEDSAKPGDHGLIRTDFPGGWKNDNTNAFSGENMKNDQLEMQNYMKTILNFRKNSKAIHYGQTLHFAPIDGVYLISRKKDDETVIYIVNKNNSSKELNLDRFNQLGVNNVIFTEVYTKEIYKWTNSITLKKNSSIILTNR